MKKVAIVGSGISGLSCAYTLEQSGITPVIFEKKFFRGDSLRFTSIQPFIFLPHHKKTLQFINKKYKIALKPLETLQTIYMHSPKQTVRIDGNLGWIFKRGKEPYSLENQIKSLVQTPIEYESLVSIEELQREFDAVVVATGNSIESNKLGIWKTTFNAVSRCSTVLGSFSLTAAHIWFNTEFARQGFGFFIPHTCNEGTLALVVNDTSHFNLDYYWKKFINSVPLDITIIETQESQHICGYISDPPPQGIFLVGNAAGFVDDLIGVGSFNAIESGCLAARSIISNEDYWKLTQPIRESVMKIHKIREVINSFDNNHFDTLVFLLRYCGVANFLYQSPLFNITQLTPVANFSSRWIHPMD